MRKFAFITLAAALSVLLFSLACGIFAPAIDGVFLWPGFRISRAIGISIGDAGNYLASGIAFGWVLWTVIVAAVVTVVEKTIWRRRKLFVVCAIAACSILFLEALGRHNKEFEGTWEVGLEQSDFHPGDGCWHTPYWLEATPELYGRFAALGNPRALKVKFVGDSTSIGGYGNGGQYLRSVRVVRVIDVKTAQPCRK